MRKVGAEYEFLGRMDRQLAVNGVRVEPSEVERVLASLSGVREAAVLQHTLGANGRKVLCAVLSPETLDVAEIRAALEQLLPPWMCPRRYRCVSHMPRGASGKLDFAALAELQEEASHAKEAQVAEMDSAVQPPLLAELAAMWSEVLGVARVRSGDDFFSLGGDSLAAVELAVLAQSRGLCLSAAAISEHSAFAQQLEVLRARFHADQHSTIELRREVARLVAELPLPCGQEQAPPVEPVGATWLVTGATGSVGSYALAELLARTSAPVACLVRAADAEAGKARVLRALAVAGAQIDPTRLRVVIGDVSRARFGLAPEAYAALARGIQAVLHCAGRVHAVESYERLRPANVLGSLEALRFCRTATQKALHFVSSLSVFVSTDRATGTLREDDHLESTRWVRGGYAQSKWVAEHLVRSAGAAAAVSIYRLGLVTPDSKTGRGTTTDQLGHLIRGLARLGAVPRAQLDVCFDVTPVDSAARAMVELMLRPGAVSQTFHIANPHSASLGMLLQAMRAAGPTMQEVSAQDWARLGARAYRRSDTALAYLSLCRGLPGAEHRGLDLFQATGARFCTANSRRLGAEEPSAPCVDSLLPIVRGALELTR